MLRGTHLAVSGTDRKGKRYPTMLTSPMDYELLETIVLLYRKYHPQCIHVEVHIAFPDPDYVAEQAQRN